MAAFLPTLLLLTCLASHGMCSPLAWLITQTEDVADVDNTMRQRRSSGCDDQIGSCPTEIRIKPRISRMNVTTTITARFASTTVVTEVINEADTSQETKFRFRLSKDAFISDFFMVVGGRTYQAEVKEREEAQQAYEDARDRNQTVAQVKLIDDDFTKFETDISLSPNTSATFHLTYQELLRREGGMYNHKVNLFPQEVVPDLQANVYLTEPQGISFADVSWHPEEGLLPGAVGDALAVNRDTDTSVVAILRPSQEDQEGISETGLHGNLVVTYDVVHDVDAGNIQLLNNYFVHHVSPTNLEATKKNVVFVIDKSGSMSGTKLAQTKLAMATIIDDIRSFDTFNILSFSDEVDAWKRNLVVSSEASKRSAKQFVDNLSAGGGTNIKQGLDEAITRLKTVGKSGLSMIILLTDGQATSGVTDSGQIIREITASIQGSIALFGLAFGESADFYLLERLAGFNQGVARKIHSSPSPSEQLHGFYEEVATPLLYDIDVRYSDGAVDLGTLTRSHFKGYFEGTEMVIAGKLKETYQDNEFVAVVSAESANAPVEYELTKNTDETITDAQAHQVENFAERLWAYLTVQDLLLRYKIALNDTERETLREKATEIALKYKFVTPLTSLIVIKPSDGQNNEDLLSFEEGEKTGEDGRMYPANTGGGVGVGGGGGGGGGGSGLLRALPLLVIISSMVSLGHVVCSSGN